MGQQPGFAFVTLNPTQPAPIMSFPKGWLIVFLMFVLSAVTENHLTGQTKSQQNPKPVDRSTAKAAFRVYRKGLEQNSQLESVKTLSKQYKRFLFFEILFAAGTVAEPKHSQATAFFKRHGVDEDKLLESSKSLEEFLNHATKKIKDMDSFLAGSLEILNKDNKPNIGKKKSTVIVDGNRAVATHEGLLYSYHKRAGEDESIEIVSSYEIKTYLRKFGNEWRICLEGEWKDPEFVWKVPD